MTCSFILSQLQENNIVKYKQLHTALVDLEKGFDRVTRKVLRRAIRMLGVGEWVIRVVQAMYKNAKSKAKLNVKFSEEFSIKFGDHQGAVLSPVLFVINMEALSREFKTDCPWELLYTDDLVLIVDALAELKMALKRKDSA